MKVKEVKFSRTCGRRFVLYFWGCFEGILQNKTFCATPDNLHGLHDLHRSENKGQMAGKDRFINSISMYIFNILKLYKRERDFFAMQGKPENGTWLAA